MGPSRKRASSIYASRNCPPPVPIGPPDGASSRRRASRAAFCNRRRTVFAQYFSQRTSLSTFLRERERERESVCVFCGPNVGIFRCLEVGCAAWSLRHFGDLPPVSRRRLNSQVSIFSFLCFFLLLAGCRCVRVCVWCAVRICVVAALFIVLQIVQYSLVRFCGLGLRFFTHILQAVM
jgi:hypothetical protein